MQAAKKSITFKLRMSPAEKRCADRVAKRLGLSVAAAIRMLVKREDGSSKILT